VAEQQLTTKVHVVLHTFLHGKYRHEGLQKAYSDVRADVAALTVKTDKVRFCYHDYLLYDTASLGSVGSVFMCDMTVTQQQWPCGYYHGARYCAYLNAGAYVR
jgi:hypothetical protein